MGPCNAGCACLIFLLLMFPRMPALAADVTVHTSRDGDTFYVEATAELAADVKLIWQVLTDYDGLAQFIPGLNSSRVVSRSDNHVIIDQKGDSGLLFFTLPVEVRLEAEEFPYRTITSRAVTGNFKEMRNAYQLETSGTNVRLTYRGSMTPDFSVPLLIGTLAVRRNVERQFGAMVDEIERRSRQPRPSVVPSRQP